MVCYGISRVVNLQTSLPGLFRQKLGKEIREALGTRLVNFSEILIS